MPTYNIQPNSVSPGGEEQNMPYQQIMPILHGLAPGDVASAGAAFENLGKTLDAVAENLRKTAMKLAADNSWRGAAAQAAMDKFQQLHDQAAQLAANAHTTANSVNWIGNEVLPKYKAIPAPQVMGASSADAAAGSAIGSVVMPGAGGVLGAGAGYVAGALGIGPDGQAKADTAARQYLASLNGHLASAPFPSSISGSDPFSKGGQGGWITPGSHGGGGSGYGGGSGIGGGMGGAGGAGGGAPMPGYSPSAGAGHFTPAKLPSNAPSASLQGYATPTGSPTGSPFGPGSPGGVNPMGGGSANPFSRMPTTMPVGGFGKGGLPGAGSIPGESGLAKSAAGEAGAAAEGAAGEAARAEAAGAAGAAEGGGMAGMPMTGAAGSGQQDKERQRQAWMHEDEDIWGVPQDDIGPIIG